MRSDIKVILIFALHPFKGFLLPSWST